MDIIVNSFHEIGVDKQIEPVLDSLWEIGNKSIPFDLLGPSSMDLQLLIPGNGKLKMAENGKLKMAENGKLKDWRILMG